MFDEPSSYLDVKQRLNAARMIRSLLVPENYVIVIEHDLSVLDYLSDFICVFYGQPGAYGVVTMPYSVREGINVFKQLQYMSDIVIEGLKSKRSLCSWEVLSQLRIYVFVKKN